MDGSVDAEFRRIIGPQVRIEMANTLGDMLSSNSNFSPNSRAVGYVVDRLWVDDHVYRQATGKPDPTEESEQ